MFFDRSRTNLSRLFCFACLKFDLSDAILKIHGRTHVTGIELVAESNKIFGGPDEICSTCIINLNNDESVVQIRYRQAINRAFGRVVPYG